MKPGRVLVLAVMHGSRDVGGLADKPWDENWIGHFIVSLAPLISDRVMTRTFLEHGYYTLSGIRHELGLLYATVSRIIKAMEEM